MDARCRVKHDNSKSLIYQILPAPAPAASARAHGAGYKRWRLAQQQKFISAFWRAGDSRLVPDPALRAIITSALTSSSRCAGRQWRKIDRGWPGHHLGGDLIAGEIRAAAAVGFLSMLDHTSVATRSASRAAASGSRTGSPGLRACSSSSHPARSRARRRCATGNRTEWRP